MEICGAIYVVDSERQQGLDKLPIPVRCSLPAKHSGSHSYSDNIGGVSWDNDLTQERKQPNFPSVIEYNRQQARERRERIATAAMAGILANSETPLYEIMARMAVNTADALIAELDKGE